MFGQPLTQKQRGKLALWFAIVLVVCFIPVWYYNTYVRNVLINKAIGNNTHVNMWGQILGIIPDTLSTVIIVPIAVTVYLWYRYRKLNGGSLATSASTTTAATTIADSGLTTSNKAL
jgi:hypothetical protein